MEEAPGGMGAFFAGLRVSAETPALTTFLNMTNQRGPTAAELRFVSARPANAAAKLARARAQRRAR